MTELIWDGKYDANGRKSAPPRIVLPFQTVETVNESAADRLTLLDMFRDGKDAEWRNRLIWGDKKYVLPSLLPEFAGKVNLIYIDPPFDTGANFSYLATIPDAPTGTGRKGGGPLAPNSGGTGEDASDSGSPELGRGGLSFVKEPSVIEQKAYRDTWGKGLDSYLKWFYETAVLLRELLAEDGSLYVHLDYHVSHYAKALLDEVFGADRFMNEVVWKRTSSRSDAKTYNHIHDIVLFYTRSEKFTWTQQFTEHSESYQADKYGLVDADGRRYQLTDITSPNPRPNMMYDWKGFAPPEKGWRFSKETMARLDAEGRIWYPNDKSRRPRYRRYLDETQGRVLDSVWTDIFPVNS